MQFIHSFQSEWLKRKRSASSWLVIIGACFIPSIMLLANFINAADLPEQTKSPLFWEMLFTQHWESMSIFLMPMGIVLSTSLIAQLEYKNNAWKQLHTTPQLLSTIFFAKLSVIVVMMLQFFVLFNIGIYLVGVIPALILPSVPYPVQSFPFLFFVKHNVHFFIDCLPIIALQFFLSMRFKNFLASVGIGLAMIIGSLIALSWQYGYVIPYTYPALNYMEILGDSKTNSVNIHLLAIFYFLAITGINYFLYLNKKERG